MFYALLLTADDGEAHRRALKTSRRPPGEGALGLVPCTTSTVFGGTPSPPAPPA